VGKTGLVTGLVPGTQDWKCPGSLAQTWDQAQMTQIYSNPLNFFLKYKKIKKIPCHQVWGMSPVVPEFTDTHV
jgi:hypothetical protein